jgi:aspartokinase/homoserine dehydrogenase 1
MQVLKFGGSSVANADNIRLVAAVISEKIKDDSTVVIVSALGGITDLLLQCGRRAAEGDESYLQNLKEVEQRHLDTVKEIIPLNNQSGLLSYVKTQCNEIEDICKGVFVLKELTSRTMDLIISYGELLSSKIINGFLSNLNCKWIDAREIIITNNNYGNAIVDFNKSNILIKSCFKENSPLYIVPGFIASDDKGITTTLGRGGSDYTAAIIAAAIDASILEIWTDVSGMMTADPRLVTNSRIIPQISYQEAMELSHFGAKVIYPPTIQPVMSKGIAVKIKNTFLPDDEGTVVMQNTAEGVSNITGISSIGKISLVSLEGSGMVGIPGFSHRLFAALATNRINVILITQSSSEHSICVGIEDANASLAKKVIDEAFEYEIQAKKVEPLIIENDLAIIALVGDRMKNHTGISGRLFNALGNNGVNIRAISQGSSERNISAVISSNDVKKALNVIHEAFFEMEVKEVNIFVAGVGNVGKKLLEQIRKQQKYLLDSFRLRVKVIGLANSKKILIDEKGINLADWEKKLAESDEGRIDDFIKILTEKNLRNTVFTDVTANEEVANTYPGLLEKSIAIVACNKIACSTSYPEYKRLKDLVREFNGQLLFETNVGAGLPVIGSLNDLVKSGDKVHKMQAVLSGTLNFVFNNYDGKQNFASVVKRAQDEGYTEPDPRLDLSGKDVMRKILILAREAGETMEIDDIVNNSFMPDECMTGSVDDFYTSMEKHEPHFRNLLDKAKDAGSKLKFVATYENGKASVGLQHIGPEHDFYHLYGKDNIVLFFTDRYVEQPLVIKGAGAGAEVTAAGVFADIIRSSKR